MISIYNDIISYEGDEWEDYLNRICIIDIFKDFIPRFKDKALLTQAIRYVVWTYSKQSDCVILGDDWLLNKKRIFDRTLLPDEYYEDLVLLQNPMVVKTIQRWIDFQDNELMTTIYSLKELMIEMRISSNSNIKNAALETNYDQKYKNANYAIELKLKIADLESELIQNDNKLKEAVREVRTAQKNKNTIGAETFAN